MAATSAPRGAGARANPTKKMARFAQVAPGLSVSSKQRRIVGARRSDPLARGQVDLRVRRADTGQRFGEVGGRSFTVSGDRSRVGRQGRRPRQQRGQGREGCGGCAKPW